MSERMPRTAAQDGGVAENRGGQASCRAELSGLLSGGRSAALVGVAGMGRSALLHGAVTDVARGRKDLLVLRMSPLPFVSHTGRVLEVVRALIGAARERGAVDAVWPELARGWDGELDALPRGDLTAALALLIDFLREAYEAAAGRVLVVVDDLAAWLPADAGTPDERRTLEGALRALLERPGAPSLRLAFGLLPDAARPRSGGWPGLLAETERVPLEPLSPEECTELLRRETAALGEADVAWVMRMVGGHPGLVRELGRILERWHLRRGGLDDAARLSLTATLDPLVREVVEEGIALLRRMDAGVLIDRLFTAAVTAEPAAFGPGDLLLLWPLGLVGADDRIPERLRVVVARGAALARAVPGRAAGTAAERAAGTDGADGLTPRGARAAAAGGEGEDGGGDGTLEREGLSGDADDPLAELGRKERLLYNYLRERPGEPVPWKELAAAYFSDELDGLEDEEKALRSLRAAVNRVNAKLAPSEGAARGGWKMVRYARSRGFYVDRDAVASLGH
jgi:hypothetical protein